MKIWELIILLFILFVFCFFCIALSSVFLYYYFIRSTVICFVREFLWVNLPEPTCGLLEIRCTMCDVIALLRVLFFFRWLVCMNNEHFNMSSHFLFVFFVLNGTKNKGENRRNGSRQEKKKAISKISLPFPFAIFSPSSRFFDCILNEWRHCWHENWKILCVFSVSLYFKYRFGRVIGGWAAGESCKEDDF